MNVSETWPSLFNIATPADPGVQLRLKVLYSSRKQVLLVPLGMQQAHDAVNFFIQKPILKYWGHLCIKLDYYLPCLHVLPDAEFRHFPIKTLFAVNAEHITQSLHGISLFCGFPGPLQKLTIYCAASAAGEGKVAKLSVHSTANAAIEKEAYWLNSLSLLKATAGFLPKLLQYSELACKRRALTMMALPKGHASKTFSPAHHAFLRSLAQQQAVFNEWRHCEAHLRLKQRVQDLSGIVESEVVLFWQALIDEIEQATANLTIPNLMMHGDFAPWNLRQHDTALYVFDWEYAETYGNPLQDFLHFHLITQALKGHGLTHALMKNVLKKAAIYSDKQYGEHLDIKSVRGALTLHYLLDTVTFYAQASGYLDAQHPVLRHYINMLRQRQAWLPKNPVLMPPHIQQQCYENELELT